MAKTARASTRKMLKRNTHKLAPCKFSHRAPNHAIMATKTNPIPPAKCCQESCINCLPSQNCGEPADFPSVAAQQGPEDHEKQHGGKATRHSPDGQTPDPRHLFPGPGIAFRS